MAAEQERACGFRKIGGIYLEGEKGPGLACGRLPVPVQPCPSCGQEVRFTRALQRVKPSFILHAAPECARTDCPPFCPFNRIREQQTAGLIWIGNRYYTPEAFSAEAQLLGVSRRLPWVPQWVRPGETWIMAAHRAACSVPCTCDRLPLGGLASDAGGGAVCQTCGGSGRAPAPGVFYLFRARRIVQIIPDTMPEEKRQELIARGLELVEVPADDPDHQGADVEDFEDARQDHLWKGGNGDTARH